MSKKNKVVYSNIQPNTKEAGIWVNTNDGNIKIERDGKWIDDGSNEVSTIEYLDVSGLDILNTEGKDFSIGAYAFSVKMTISNKLTAFIPSSAFQSYSTFPETVVVHAVAIDFSFPTSIFGGEILTIKETLISLGLTQEQLDAIPRITKEQFYSLES